MTPQDFGSVLLNNGVERPRIGIGTFQLPSSEATVNLLTSALRFGYRHIDTASHYQNEDAVGEAVRRSKIPREQVFVSSKVWNTDQGYKETLEAFNASLTRLRFDYLDQYLIHWPKTVSLETWRAMTELYDAGKIRCLGVSNFKIHHLQELLDNGGVKPASNQVELHPYWSQTELRDYCRQHGIAVTSWGPFMQGKIFGKQQIRELAQKYGKTIAQFALRWQYQIGVSTVFTSRRLDRLISNVDIFNFEISDEDMTLIAGLHPEQVGPDADKIAW